MRSREKPEARNKLPSVLLIDAEPSRQSILKRALQDYSYPVVGIENDANDLLEDIDDYKPELIVVGIDLPDDATLRKLGLVSNLVPVVMFAEKDTPKIIKKTIKAGISAFIVDDIQPQRLPSIISVAIARFKEQQSLRDELETTKTKLAERKQIERAKGILMKQSGQSEEEAYAALRKMAMDKGQGIGVVAENIIDVLELMEK